MLWRMWLIICECINYNTILQQTKWYAVYIIIIAIIIADKHVASLATHSVMLSLKHCFNSDI